MDADHAELREISCSSDGSHPATKLACSCCLSSRSIPCQGLLRAYIHTAHLCERCVRGLLAPLPGVFLPFLTENAVGENYQHSHSHFLLFVLCKQASVRRRNISDHWRAAHVHITFTQSFAVADDCILGLKWA